MENIFHQQIKKIVDSLDINDDQQFIFSENKYIITNPHQQKNITSKEIIEELTDFIYEHFYCNGSPQEQPESLDYYANQQLQQTFITQLNDAIQTEESLSDGWKISEIGQNGMLYLSKGNHVRTTFPGEFIRSSFLSHEIKKDEMVKLSVRKKYSPNKNGFFHVFGSTLAEGGVQIVRYYFNITPQGAPILIDNLTRQFNHYKIPFQFKCMNHPHLFNRADAAVLYVNKRYCNYAMEIFNKFYPTLDSHLKDEVPFFSKEIKKGIGFAENPPNGDSFGMSRSRIIAQALFKATKKELPKTEWLGEVYDLFRQNNLAVEQLYLNPSSHFTYSFIN